MKKTTHSIAFLLVALASGQMANASPIILNQGFSAVPVLDTSSLGVLVASATATLAPLSGTFSGTEHEEVYQQANGLLVFAYQLNIGPGTAPPGGGPTVSDPVTRATMNPFTGYSTAVAYNNTAFGGFTASNVAPMSADRNAGGDTIGFDTFGLAGAGVSAGNSSAIMLVFTNAKAFQRFAFMSASDGGTATSFAAGPAGVAAPETSTMLLMGTGLMGLSLVRCKALAQALKNRFCRVSP